MYRILLLLLIAVQVASSQNFTKFYQIHNMPSSTGQMQIPGEAKFALTDGGNGYFVAGQTPLSGGSGHTPYLLKIDASGDSLWAKRYDYWNDGRLFHFRENAQNQLELYVSALTHSPGPDNRAIIIRVDPANGDTLSTEVLAKHTTCNNLGYYHAIEFLPDNSLILSYRDHQPGAGSASNVGKIYKVNVQGHATWNFEHDATPNSYQYFYDIMWDGTDVIACGSEVAAENNYQGEFCLTSVDTSGQLNWSTTITSPNSPWGYRWFGLARSVVQNSQGEYLVGGLMKFPGDVMPNSGVVIKFSPSGDSLDYSRYPYSRDIRSIVADGQGNFVVTGQGLLDSSHGPNVYLEKAMLGYLDNNGSLGQKVQLGDTNKYQSWGEAHYFANNALSLSGSRFLLLGSGFRNSQGVNTRISMVSALSFSGLSHREERLEPSLTIYPNPAYDHFSIATDDLRMPVKIFGPNSQLMAEYASVPHERINVSNWPTGLYLLQVGEQSVSLLIRP